MIVAVGYLSAAISKSKSQELIALTKSLTSFTDGNIIITLVISAPPHSINDFLGLRHYPERSLSFGNNCRRIGKAKHIRKLLL